MLPEDEELLDYWMGVDLEGEDEDLDAEVGGVGDDGCLCDDRVLLGFTT